MKRLEAFLFTYCIVFRENKYQNSTLLVKLKTSKVLTAKTILKILNIVRFVKIFKSKTYK